MPTSNKENLPNRKASTRISINFNKMNKEKVADMCQPKMIYSVSVSSLLLELIRIITPSSSIRLGQSHLKSRQADPKQTQILSLTLSKYWL